MPRLVGEVGVGRDRVDLDAQALELGVAVSQVAQLGGADEGEVGRIEEHDGPLALEVGVAHLDELAVVERSCLEGLDLGVDERHGWRGLLECWTLVDSHRTYEVRTSIDDLDRIS